MQLIAQLRISSFNDEISMIGMMETFTKYWKLAREEFPQVLSFTLTFIAALSILIVGIIVARWLRKRFLKSRLGGDRISATLRPVLASVIFYFIIAFTLYAFLTKIGVPSSALLAVFGSAGLAVGLALKDTLGNIASGVMLLMLHPLKIGEFVDTPNYAGTVQEIGLFSTTLKNLEGLYIYVPNGQVWNNRLQNFARHTERKLMIDIGVGYDTDLDKAREILLGVLADTAGVKDMPTPPEVYVMGFGDSAINMSARCWLPADNWLGRASDVRMRIKKALDEAKIEIPFPQRVITTKK